MRARLRLAAWWEHLRGSMWLLPAVSVALALVLGTALASVRPFSEEAIGGLVFGGSPEGARNVLGVIAGATITVTGLTFSLTAVALQMASGQFSPRVMRNFLTDLGNQLVLGIFLATFAYSLAVIHVIRGGDGLEGEVVPRLAVTVGILLAIAAVGALVYFVHHLTRQLRVDTIMDEIVADTLRSIDRVYPRPATDAAARPDMPRPHGPVSRVAAQRSGYLQAVTIDGLVRAARDLDAVVQLRPPIGEHVPEGATLAWVWPRDGSEGARADLGGNRWQKAAHDHVHLGAERTMRQDVAFGLRQLADIATRALSPGTNDPTTAIEALARLSVVLCRLAGRQLDVGVIRDAHGHVRAIRPVAQFSDYLALGCGQPRRYGAGDPQVLVALLDLLADVAEVVTGEHQRAEVERECARTLEMAERELDDTDLVRVRASAELVRATLEARERPRPAPPDAPGRRSAAVTRGSEDHRRERS